MIVNNIILVILLGLTSDVQGVMNIKMDTLQDMVSDVISNNSQNPSFHRRLMRRDLSDKEINTVLEPLFGKKPEIATFMNKLNSFFSQKFPADSGGIDPSVSSFMGKIGQAVNDAKFNANDTTSKNNLISILKKADEAYTKKKAQTLPISQSTNTGKDPGKLSLGNAGTITTKKTTIEGHIKIQKIKTQLIRISGAKREDVIPIIYSIITREFLSAEDKQYQSGLMPFINNVIDILNNPKFEPSKKEDQLSLIDAFVSLGNAYDALQNSGKINIGTDGYQAADNINKILDKSEAVAKTIAFVTKSFGNDNGGYDPAFAPFIDQLFSRVKNPEYDPNESNTKSEVKAILIQLDNIKKLTKDSKQNKSRFSNFGLKLLKKLIANEIPDDKVTSEVSGLLKKYITPAGGFAKPVNPKVQELRAILKSEGFSTSDEDSRFKLIKALTEIDLIWTGQTEEGQASVNPGMPEPLPQNASQELKDIINSFDNFRSTDFLTTRSRLRSYIEKALEENGGRDPEIEEEAKEILSMIDSVGFDLEDSEVALRTKRYLCKLEKGKFSEAEKMNLSGNLSHQPTILLSNNMDQDLQRLKEIVDNMTNETKLEPIMFVTKFLTNYYTNQNGDFNMLLFTQNEKIMNFLRSEDFKAGDSSTWEKLKSQLDQIEKLSKESANTGHFKKPKLTNDKESNVKAILDALKTTNASNKPQVLEFVEELLQNFYGQLNGGVDYNVYSLGTQLSDLIKDPNFEQDLNQSIQIAESVINQLNQSMDLAQGTAHSSFTIDNYQITGKYDADFQLMMGIVEKYVPSNLDQVLDFFNDYCNFYFLSGKNPSPEVTKEISNIFELLKKKDFNGRNGDDFEQFIYQLEHLESVGMVPSEHQPVSIEVPPPVVSAVPVFSSDPEVDQTNFYKTIRRLTKDELKAFLPYMEKYFISYFADPNGELTGESGNCIKELIKLFKTKDFDPSDPLNRQKIEASLARIEEAHKRNQEATRSTVNPYKSPNFKGNKAQDTRVLLNSLGSATEADIEEVTKAVNEYLKITYADKSGQFTGGVKDIVNQIRVFLKSKQFNPKDQASKERLQKWIYELEIVDMQMKNPGSLFGFYKNPKFTGVKKDDEDALLKSLETVTPFNKDEATSAILSFAQKHYSKDKVMDSSLISIIHKMTSMIQAPTFNRENPQNKGRMEEYLRELEKAFEKAKNKPLAQTPYETPKLGDDMDKNIELLASSLKSVNKGNQHNFESTVITFLREKFINVAGKEKPLTFSKVQQIIQYIQSPGFDSTNQISIDQFSNLLIQLKEYINGKEGDNSNNLFPLEKFTYSKEYDLKQLVEILKQFPVNSDIKNFINPTTQYLSVYFADSNGIFPFQLTRSVQNILNFVKKNIPEVKTDKFFDSLKAKIEALDDEFYIYKYPPPNSVDFDKITFSGDYENDKILLLNNVRYVKKETLPGAKSLTVKFLTGYFGQRGNSFHPTLYNLVNQVTASLTKIVTDQNALLEFNDHLSQLKSAYDKVEASFSNVTHYTIKELTGDKKSDYESFIASLKLVTPENVNRAAQACNKFIVHYYGNKDGTIPGPLQSVMQDIINYISSINFDARSGESIKKLESLFDLLEQANKYKGNPADNPALKAFKIPDLPGDYITAQQVFIKAMEQLNHYNRPQAVQFAQDYFNKYYTNNGPMSFEILPFVSTIVDKIGSPEFDGKNTNLKKEFEDSFKQLNTMWESIKDKKQDPKPIESIQFTGVMSTDYSLLMKSISSVTPDTKKIALNDVQSFIMKYYKNADNTIDRRLDATIVQIKNTINDSKFQYPVSLKQKTALGDLFNKLSNEFQKIKDPSSSGAAFKKFNPTGVWEQDKISLILTTKHINRVNKNQARDFFLQILQENFTGANKIINPAVYPYIQEILSYITAEDFKSTNPENEQKLLELFAKLEAEYDRSLKNSDKPVFIPPKLTQHKDENQVLFIEALKTVTGEIKKEARAWVEQFLKKMYGTKGGELDYSFMTTYSEFISLFDTTQELSQMSKDVEGEFKRLFHKMDDISSKLGIIEGDKPKYPPIVITGKMDDDLSNLINTLAFIKPSNIKEASNEFSRTLNYYFKNQDGSGDFKILPKLHETLEIFKRKNFDGNSEEIRKEFQTKFGELKEIYSSLHQEDKNIDHYKRIELSRDFNTDLEALIKSFDSVNNDNIEEARKFVAVFLSTYLSNSSGGFNVAISSEVSDIRLLIQAEDFTFHDKDQITKFKKMMEETYKLWKEQSSKNVSQYTTPQLSSSLENDMNELIKSMKNVGRTNNSDIIKAIEDFMKYHFSVDHSKFDYRIYPTVNSVRNLISTPEFDFSSNHNQEQIRLYLTQLSSLFNQLVKDNGAPKICTIPQLSMDKSKDRDAIPTLFVNLEPTCKKEIAGYLEKFSKNYYANSLGFIEATVAPFVSRLTTFVQSAEFDFKNKEHISEVMRKIGEIEEAAIQASKLFKTEQKFNPPELTNDTEENIEILSSALSKVTPEFSASAKAYVLNYVKEITMNHEGSIDLQYATLFNELENLLNAKDFAFTSPVSISKLVDLLRKIQAIQEYSTIDPKKRTPYTGIELTDDIAIDFTNFLKSLESVNVSNRQEVDDFVLNRFINWHFRIHAGEPYPSQILDIVIELQNLLSDSDFNYVTVENLEKFRKLIEKLIMVKEALGNPELEPLHFYPPILYGEIRQDKELLFESFSQVTLFNQLEAVKFINYFLKLHYSEKSGNFAPSVRAIVDKLLSICGKPDFELSKPNGAGIVKLYISQIEQEIKKLADEKANRPYYKAPQLTENRQINLQLLVASFKTVTKETRQDAVNFISKFLTIMYAEPEGYFIPELMKVVSDAFAIVQSQDFKFQNDDDIRKFQEALLNLEAEYARIKTPEPIAPDFIEPELSGTKYLDVVRLINSFNNINASNKHKALNFILKYLRMYYGDKEGGTFESVEITELVQKLFTLITPENFNFREFESITKVQSILNELDVEISKIRDQKVDIKFEPFDFTGNKAYDSQQLLISFRKFSPQYKGNAVSFLIKFLENYYSKDGKWDDNIYNLANQLIYIVSASDFEFDNPESAQRIQSSLIQLDMMMKNLDSKPAKLPDYLSFDFSNNFREDLKVLQKSFKSVNSRNQPDAIKQVIKFVKFYFSRKNDGKFDSRIYPFVNDISNLITSPYFDFTNDSEGYRVTDILDKMKEIQDNIEKPKPEQTWVVPHLTPSAENDRKSLFIGIKMANPKFAKDINDSIIRYLNHHYGRNNNAYPEEIGIIVNKIIELIESKGFSYQNPNNFSDLEKLFDELEKTHFNLNNPAISVEYQKPIWKNVLDEDLVTLLKSFEGMSNNSKTSILLALGEFYEKFLKSPNGFYDSEVALRFNQISQLVSSNEFNFESPDSVQTLNDLLKQVVEYYENNIANQGSVVEPGVTEPGFGRGIVIDKAALIEYVEESGFAFIDKNKIWSVINKYLLVYFGNGSSKVADTYEAAAQKLYSTIMKKSFDFTDSRCVDNFKKILDEFEQIQKNSLSAQNPIRYNPPKMTDDVKSVKLEMLKGWPFVTKKQKNDALLFLNQFLTKFYSIKDASGDAKLRKLRNQIYNLFGSEAFSYSDPDNRRRMDGLFQDLEKTYSSLTQSIVIPFEEPQLTEDKDTDETLLLSSLKMVSEDNLEAIFSFILKYTRMHYADLQGEMSQPMKDLRDELIELISKPNFNGNDDYHIASFRLILMNMDDLKEQENAFYSSYDSYYGSNSNYGSGYGANSWRW